MLGRMLGKGGFGEVYALRDDPAKCIKITSKKSNCREWKNEFDTIQKIHAKIGAKATSMKMTRILEPITFQETDDICMMLMPRIYRPEGDDVEHTYQVFLGKASEDRIVKGRGHIIGVKQVLEFISQDDLEVAVRELGVLMALIHHVAKQNAYDVELLMGLEYNKKKIRFYIADFDMSKPITDFGEDTIEDIAWSIEAVPYFPLPGNPLFRYFEEGYRSVRNDQVVDDIFEQLS